MPLSSPTVTLAVRSPCAKASVQSARLLVGQVMLLSSPLPTLTARSTTVPSASAGAASGLAERSTGGRRGASPTSPPKNAGKLIHAPVSDSMNSGSATQKPVR